ncbi:helix-turn-helix domain-containing protein [Paraburkholderia sp. MM6662-R1]|uniref:helix-turn-helix domain-containing protein n=1 Tax=Paraburkholderia sp. MM6662-R1 TaxID=2991066 RepID=UPI003D22B2A3
MSTKQSPLRKVRHGRGLTLDDVARKIGTDTGNLSRIERGLQCPKAAMAAKLAEFFAREIEECHVTYPERYADWVPPDGARAEEKVSQESP